MNPQFLISSRRSFVKKSLVAGIAASQPMILAGLIRASGVGAGDKTSTETSDPYTTFPQTTDPYGFDTTIMQSTNMDTTVVQTDTTINQYY